MMESSNTVPAAISCDEAFRLIIKRMLDQGMPPDPARDSALYEVFKAGFGTGMAYAQAIDFYPTA